MPITMHKPRRYPKHQSESIKEKDHMVDSSNSFASKFINRIPAALILLFLIFLWSSSTTFISGSIFHVCVTSRKLSDHLYCLSAGAQPSNLDISGPIPMTSLEAPPNVPISNVFRTPLSSLSNSAKESISFTKNVKAPSAVAIQVPSSGGGEKKKTLDDATRKPIIQVPSTSGGVKSNNILRESKSTTSPTSALNREKIEDNTTKQPREASSITKMKSNLAKHLTQKEYGPKNKTITMIQPPSTNEGVKSKNVVKEREASTTPSSIAIREKIEDNTTNRPKEVSSDTKINSTPTPTPVAAMQKVNKTKLEEEIELGKKDAEEQMEILRSYKIGNSMNYSDPKACDGRGIFVYNLPSKFNKDLLGHCSEMITWMDFCKFLSNNAFGEPIPELGDGWYNTHQYALEPIFHTRVLKHPCRVHNPEEAKVFYVPYYGGLDILRWHFKKNITMKTKDKLSYELIEWLSKQSPWKKNYGLDHLFVLGKISWDFRRMQNFTWGTHFLDMDEMQSSMKLLIERHPWHINDIGVPHPSFFHPRSDNDIFAWQKKIMQVLRKNLVSFAGAPRKARESIRSILIEQCTSSSDKCKFFDCREGRCTKPAPMVQLFTESEFCLQPVGDSPTRKSVFDSLVSGCIPVLFSPFTAYYQYPWHLPVNQSNYSVFIDQEEVRRREVNVVDLLAAISPARRAEMRRYIVYELLPGLVYADPNGKLDKFEDGFSVAMNSVLERMSRLP